MLEKTGSFSDSFSFKLKSLTDERGSFTKLFHQEQFKNLGLQTDWQEQYVSTSEKGVIRGLHFQTPPHAHDKMVVCLYGDVFDVVVDLRKNSKTYGQHHVYKLGAPEGVYIPKGFAHGFCALSKDRSVLLYSTSTTHSVAHDQGILWNSLNIDWPVQNPIMSARDKSFKKFSEFQSPF